MGKKRSSNKVRQQDYPDAEDFEYVRDKMQEIVLEEVDQSSLDLLRPTKIIADYSQPSRYKDGDLVTVASSQVSGTVIHCVGKELFILDSKGLTHHVLEHEVYLTQA